MDSFSFTVTAETASALQELFDEQNRELIEDLLDGKGQFTLERGDRKVDIAPVRHGKWIEKSYWRYECSECGELPDGGLTDYCPNCGAKMDGGE